MKNGSRKLLTILVCVACTVGMRLSGHLSGDQLASIWSIIVPAFFAANSIEAFKK